MKMYIFLYIGVFLGLIRDFIAVCKESKEAYLKKFEEKKTV